MVKCQKKSSPVTLTFDLKIK